MGATNGTGVSPLGTALDLPPNTVKATEARPAEGEWPHRAQPHAPARQGDDDGSDPAEWADRC
jgi:hypothetical protein